MVTHFSSKKVKMFIINLYWQSYGSIFYQLYITITIRNEDQNSCIFNL